MFTSATTFATPQIIRVDGMIYDNAGNPVSGSPSITVSAFAASTGGAALWTSHAYTPTVTNGKFTIDMDGSYSNPAQTLSQAIAAQGTGASIWFEISYAGNIVRPRIRARGTAFAVSASTADAIQNIPVSTATPGANNVLSYSGGTWGPTSVTSLVSGSYLALSGGSMSGNLSLPALTLSAASVNVSSLSATHLVRADTNGNLVSVTASVADSDIANIAGTTANIQTQLNAKLTASGGVGNMTSSTPALSITGGTGSVIGGGVSLALTTATASTNGLLVSSDWNTFNNKQTNLGYVPVNRAGDTMSGALSVGANVNANALALNNQGATANTACATLGSIAFDFTANSPIFCNSASVWTLFSSVSLPTLIVLTSGTSWTIPASASALKVTVIGAGGSGAGGNTTTYTSGGGGAGGIAESVFSSVTPGAILTYSIGTGGVSSTSAAGHAGGSTSITIGTATLTANGGGAGALGLTSSQGAVAYGGTGGTATGGQLNVTGSAGGDGFQQYNDTTGSGANSSPYGSGGIGAVYSSTGSYAAVAGFAGSGMGAGGSGGFYGGASGAGANGGIVIEYFTPTGGSVGTGPISGSIIQDTGLSPSQIVFTNGASTLSSSASGVTDTQLGYLANVTQNIQPILTGAIQRTGDTMSGNLQVSGEILSPQLPATQNVGLTASIAANALTVNLVGENGSAPSATNPVGIKFRSSTVTSGTQTTLWVTSALSITIPSGTTIGTINNDPQYISVYAVNNAGTVALAVSVDGFKPENKIISTTAISGGTSATTLYSTSAIASVPVRYLGKILAPQTTAGTWAASPTEVSVTARPAYPITDWYSVGAMTIGGATTPPTKGTVLAEQWMWRRVGDSMEISYMLNQTSAGTAGSGLYLFPIPWNYSMDSTKIIAGTQSSSSSQGQEVGHANIDEYGTAYGSGAMTAYDTTHLIAWLTSAYGTTFYGSNIFSSFWYQLIVPTAFSFRATVPISGWTTGN